MMTPLDRRSLSTSSAAHPYVPSDSPGSAATRKIDRCLRYYHTLRFLRPVQMYGRAWHRLAPHVQPGEGPTLPRRAPRGGWEVRARREQTMVAPTTFRFLNRSFDIATSPGGWNLSDAPEKLWLLNLHYFDDLNATDADKRRDWHYALVSDWIARNPPAEGIGWKDAYAVSLRIVNWIKWHLSGNPLPDAALQSLARQIRHLEGNLETYLLGNHVLANAKALIFAGAFFEGVDADRWRKRGLQLLERELKEEILEDGGHYERSPMYHGIVLEDLLDLFQLSRLFPDALGGDLPQRLTKITGAMRFWLQVMSHPDGEISFFNDAAIGIAPNAEALETYALRLGHAATPALREGLTRLDVSGYARYQRGPLCALVDVGEIGPDHIPGHAHADTLSFELSLFGQRILVNSGTSAYKIQPTRSRERGTAAHNTVTVDGQDSSEVWGAFRVARRARPRGVEFTEHGSQVVIEAAHDGYLRLPGKVMHQRTFSFTEQRVGITDVLHGDFERAEARYHFHPKALSAEDSVLAIATAPSGRSHPLSLSVRADDTEVSLDRPAAYLAPCLFHPHFGVSEPSQCLVVPIAHRTDSRPSFGEFSLTWNA